MNKLLLISVLSLNILSCKQKEAVKKEEIKDISTVEVSIISERNVTDGIEASGILSAEKETKLAFKTGGQIAHIYVEEGQSVKKGQLLAELDLSEINAGVNQAKIGLAKAQRDYERVKKMQEEEAATLSNVQDARSGLDIAEQSVISARFNQKLSKIYAPESGIVLKKLSENGELIAPFYPVLVLGSANNNFVLKLGLTDKQIVKVNLGDLAEVKIDAYPTETFKAKVTQIAKVINPATGTFEIELSLLSSKPTFMTGFMATANLNTQFGKKTLTVPVSAIQEADQTRAFVFLTQNSKAVKKEIKIGKIYGSEVEVLGGLKVGDAVISTGSGFVSDGQLVNIKK